MSEQIGGTQPSEEFLNEYSGNILIAESIAFAALTTVIVVLRYYSKRFNPTPLGLDDFFLVAAYIVNLLLCALGILMVYVGGVGQHVIAIEERGDVELLIGWAKCILAFEFIYFASVALPKLAIVSLYLRIFNWRGAMRNTAIALMVLVAALSFSLIMTACFQCMPLAFWWDKTIKDGTCIDVQAFFHAQAIPGIVLDFFIMTLPIHTIWNLKLPTAKRIALIMIFLVGSFGIVASIIRAFTFFGTAAFGDRTWASVELVGWSTIEISTYIITVCLPHLKPLISHYTPKSVKRLVKRTLSSVGATISSTANSKNMSRMGKKSRLADDDMMELTLRSQQRGGDLTDLDTPTGSVVNGLKPTSQIEVGSVKRSDSYGGKKWGGGGKSGGGGGAEDLGKIRVTTQITQQADYV